MREGPPTWAALFLSRWEYQLTFRDDFRLVMLLEK